MASDLAVVVSANLAVLASFLASFTIIEDFFRLVVVFLNIILALMSIKLIRKRLHKQQQEQTDYDYDRAHKDDQMA